eukprot:GFUD01034253.1.p1 GENE.GFUD01034253.1~~GFUD01034253.1.p1  ORF type:complete len:193 (+),score=44.81 GFUD01034253.1:82-660(+)
MDTSSDDLEQEVKALKRKLVEQKEKFDQQKEEHDLSKIKMKKQDHFIQKLKDRIECAVCMDIPRSGPVPVCPRGHFVCEICKRDSCPTCRTEMGLGRSLLSVTILENIDHKCKFEDCNMQFRLEDLEKHEKECPQRNVNCPKNDCTKIVPLAKLVDHLISSNACCLEIEPNLISTNWKIRNYLATKTCLKQT